MHHRLTTAQCLDAIAQHSAGLATAARGNLNARVQHCPDWSVGDLVWHVTGVHWFWTSVADELPQERPERLLQDENRPTRPESPDELLEAFEVGARRMVEVLGRADQAASCWTWAPAQQDVAFITRHQVQEAAVHHWDAANARRAGLPIEPLVAADSVDEFLTFSVSSDADPADATRPPLAATFTLRAADLDSAWTLTDGKTPGTVRVQPGTTRGVPTLEASASDLLLWLYRRAELDSGDVPQDVVDRFRALCFTD